ncbi:hypothetical protein Mapa_001919 [Marchantia paleacea]|nr:hypothetical protein Mapa_001919 [Marchantia paleacea]
MLNSASQLAPRSTNYSSCCNCSKDQSRLMRYLLEQESEVQQARQTHRGRSVPSQF